MYVYIYVCNGECTRELTTIKPNFRTWIAVSDITKRFFFLKVSAYGWVKTRTRDWKCGRHASENKLKIDRHDILSDDDCLCYREKKNTGRMIAFMISFSSCHIGVETNLWFLSHRKKEFLVSSFKDHSSLRITENIFKGDDITVMCSVTQVAHTHTCQQVTSNFPGDDNISKMFWTAIFRI